MFHKPGVDLKYTKKLLNMVCRPRLTMILKLYYKVRRGRQTLKQKCSVMRRNIFIIKLGVSFIRRW